MKIHDIVAESLKPQALSALQQAKAAIVQQRDQDLAAWQQDFEKNTAQKFIQAKQVLDPAPASAPTASYSELRQRLVGVDQAIALMQQLDKLKAQAEKAGVMTPGLTADTDVDLYMKNAQQDNYAGLIEKLERGIAAIKQRMAVRRAAYK